MARCCHLHEATHPLRSKEIATWSAIVADSDWYWSTAHGQPCQLLDSRALWGEQLARIWLPGLDTVAQVRADGLSPLPDVASSTLAQIGFAAAAARIASALAGDDVLLAPLEGGVTPLPHQIRALGRAVRGDRLRYLLADEVGLGKTIEAGLVLRELKLRGLVRRALIVAPRGLITQWIAEMRSRFGEEFRLLQPGEQGAQMPDETIWQRVDQVICSMDAVKPVDTRRGWSKEQLAAYNRARFEGLVSAGWDLVIVDEAHRLGGSSDAVARYRLGQGLAGAAPALLLLSATPHQGKTDAFARLIALLDPAAIPDRATLNREQVHPYVIRTEKRQAIDAEGRPLFQPRTTTLLPIAWQPRHQEQQLLYEAVTEYVRDGYNQALAEHRTYIGFLMILIQRLVTSSTQAIAATLERRLAALQAPEEQLSLTAIADEEWQDMDGQEQVETLLRSRLSALKNEQVDVRLLLDAAQRAALSGPDAKAEALLETIYRLQREEGDPALKVLVFTEFVPTQAMLHTFMADRGFPTVCLNGSMGMEERRAVQEAFAGEARILISTDAGGEGLNLQFCHIVVNYDIPWNPMRLEQRIGRVDRIGQRHPVRALNFVLEDTVEFRVREVLEQKLALILKELGVDKAGDVLDSAQDGALFDDLYVQSLLDPEHLQDGVGRVVRQVREQGGATKRATPLLRHDEPLDPAEARRVLEHPLPHWVERMTVNALASIGGGVALRDAVLNARTAGPLRSRPLGVHEPRIRALFERLPIVVAGQPVPCLQLPDLPDGLEGLWSIWQIAVHEEADGREAMPSIRSPRPGDGGRPGERPRPRQVFALFLHDNGRVYLPTARHIWDALIADTPDPHRHLRGADAEAAHAASRVCAEAQGEGLYRRMVQERRDRRARERAQAAAAFAARRRIVERAGLPAVRAHRLAALEAEETTWRFEDQRWIDERPELSAILVARIERETGRG